MVTLSEGMGCVDNVICREPCVASLSHTNAESNTLLNISLSHHLLSQIVLPPFRSGTSSILQSHSACNTVMQCTSITSLRRAM